MELFNSELLQTRDKTYPTLSSSKVNKHGFLIPSLDGIRAVAVFIVFISHVLPEGMIPGNFGVTIFFFLSGYLITTLLRIEYDKSGRISFKAFYVRRTLRILPPFYLVLLTTTALTLAGILNNTIQLKPFLFQVFHLSNYYITYAGWWEGRAPGTFVYWSLAVEEHFYLVFPLAYHLLRQYVPSPRRQMLVLAFGCTMVLIWRCILVFVFHAPRDRTYVATDTRVDSILFGCILAVFGNPMLDEPIVSERRLKRILFPLGMIGLMSSFLLTKMSHGIFQESLRYSIQGISLYPVFMTAILYPNWGIFRTLNWKWIKFLGVLSFSLYLVHVSVIFGVHEWISNNIAISGVISLLISFAIAVSVYYIVEKPCAQLRKRFSQVNAVTPS